jgi:hypothetical protein
MAFWDQKSLEPKRKHRWLAYFHNAGLAPYAVKIASKPSFTVNESEHSYFGHKFYYPGMLVWNEISMTLVDPVGTDDASNKIMNIIERAGYKTPDKQDLDNTSRLHSMSKAGAVDALGPTLQLEQVQATKGPKNERAEMWNLFNPWIKDVKFGDLDYSSTDLVEITMTIRYDWATLDTGP